MAKRRTLTWEVEFGKIRKQIVDSFKTQRRGLMGCEAGCSNGSGRDRVCFYGRSFQASSPWWGEWAVRLPPAGSAQSSDLSWITLGMFTANISQAKALTEYIVESADSASKSPQSESKREREREREREGGGGEREPRGLDDPACDALSISPTFSTMVTCLCLLVQGTCIRWQNVANFITDRSRAHTKRRHNAPLFWQIARAHFRFTLKKNLHPGQAVVADVCVVSEHAGRDRLQSRRTCCQAGRASQAPKIRASLPTARSWLSAPPPPPPRHDRPARRACSPMHGACMAARRERKDAWNDRP